jgi:hypothetical protein
VSRVIAHGAPFVTPISAALLKNGDLVVGNGDIGVQTASATTNLLIEISPVLPGGFVGQPLQVDREPKVRCSGSPPRSALRATRSSTSTMTVPVPTP